MLWTMIKQLYGCFIVWKTRKLIIGVGTMTILFNQKLFSSAWLYNTTWRKQRLLWLSYITFYKVNLFPMRLKRSLNVIKNLYVLILCYMRNIWNRTLKTLITEINLYEMCIVRIDLNYGVLQFIFELFSSYLLNRNLYI